MADKQIRDLDTGAEEGQQTEDGETLYAAGKKYVRRPDGKVEWIGYQEVGNDPQHD